MKLTCRPADLNPVSCREGLPPFVGHAFRSAVLVLSFSLWLTGCRDSAVATYRIPKENDPVTPAQAAPAAPAGFAVAPAAAGQLEWTAPTRWKPKAASAMRKGSYNIGEEGGLVADLAITAFPGNVGGDLANVNRWRGQLQLAPITEAELAAALTPITANGLTMLVADLAGGAADKPQRLLGAIVPYAGATWFFKLTGPDALVAAEKPAYLEFLRTVKAAAPAAVPAAVAGPTSASAAAPAPMAGTAVTQAEGPALRWTAPAHWESKPASAMRKATYVIPVAGGAPVELAVTAFPGAVGGVLANVNRWRGQLQLPPITEPELPTTVTRVTAQGVPVTLVDLTGGAPERPQRLLGAIVPYGGANWFFKIVGPEPAVSAQKKDFLAFVQSLSAP